MVVHVQQQLFSSLITGQQNFNTLTAVDYANGYWLPKIIRELKDEKSNNE